MNIMAECVENQNKLLTVYRGLTSSQTRNMCIIAIVMTCEMISVQRVHNILSTEIEKHHKFRITLMIKECKRRP